MRTFQQPLNINHVICSSQSIFLWQKYIHPHHFSTFFKFPKKDLKEKKVRLGTFQQLVSISLTFFDNFSTFFNPRLQKKFNPFLVQQRTFHCLVSHPAPEGGLGKYKESWIFSLNIATSQRGRKLSIQTKGSGRITQLGFVWNKVY